MPLRAIGELPELNVLFKLDGSKVVILHIEERAKSLDTEIEDDGLPF